MDKFKLGLRTSGPQSSSGSGSVSSSVVPDETLALVPRAPRGMVSMWTCSKICAFSFAVGMVVGIALERRFKRWIRKMLRRLKDD